MVSLKKLFGNKMVTTGLYVAKTITKTPDCRICHDLDQRLCMHRLRNVPEDRQTRPHVLSGTWWQNVDKNGARNAGFVAARTFLVFLGSGTRMIIFALEHAHTQTYAHSPPRT
jgi:hypothetical protein